MLVRPLASGDLNSVVAMLRESFPRRLSQYLTYVQPGVRRLLKVQLAHPGCFPRKVRSVATEHGDPAPVAFAELTVDLPRRAFLSYVCVAPHLRGRGIAAAMIDHFLSEHSSVDEMELDVFADNERALRLYDRLGFSLRGSSTWAGRDLPPASQEVPAPNLPTALAAYATYGFCEVELEWQGSLVRFGRIGPDVLRCYGVDAFADDGLLAAARAVLPGTTQALTIVPDSDVRRLPAGTDHLVTSRRLGRTWPRASAGPHTAQQDVT